MAHGTNKKRGTERSPVSELSDDLLVEIISRVPYKSTRCCKCVCARWRDFVSHPDHRKNLPQSTLAGIFYQTYNMNRYPSLYPGYTSVSGNWCSSIDLTLSFLPKCKTHHMRLLDCCNGLLLFCSWKQPYDAKTLDYVVCNPVSEKWVVVPATSWSNKVRIIRLGFNPAVSLHFYVFEFAPACVVDANTDGDDLHIKAVVIYSSKFGAWTRIVWDCPISIFRNSKSLFYSGMLHLSADDDFVLVVDVEGNRRVIRVPMPHSAGDVHNVYLLQGQLHLAKKGASELSIWALEDYSSENWILKHNVSHLQLQGTEYSLIRNNYEVISIHPECSLIFIVRQKSRRLAELISYEIDSEELCFVSNFTWGCGTPYLPYVPLFSDSLADGH